MKGTYDVKLKAPNCLDVDVLRRGNWNVVVRSITNPPQPIKEALEAGARIEIERSDIPRVY